MHTSNTFCFRILINNGDQNISIHMGGSQKLIIMINITNVHVTLVIYNTHSLSCRYLFGPGTTVFNV